MGPRSVRGPAILLVVSLAGLAVRSPAAASPPSPRIPGARSPRGWGVVPSATPRGGGGLSDITPAGGELWAVGTSTRGRGFSEHLAADGWELVRVRQPRSSIGSALNDVAATAADDVWAVGAAKHEGYDATLVEHWDGAGWRIIRTVDPGGTAFSNGLLGVAAVGRADVWAVGENVSALPRSPSSRIPAPPAVPEPVIEHWDGKSWQVVPGDGSLSSGYLTSASGLTPNDVWAVGVRYGPSGQIGTLVEHWDGSVWTISPSPSPSQGGADVLLSVAALSGKDVWAVGVSYVQTATGTAARGLIEHWDGSRWSTVAGAAGVSGGLKDVAGTSAGQAWAAGRHTDAGGGTRTLVQEWTGSDWRISPTQDPSDMLNEFGGIVATGTLVWAVGGFGGPSGRLRTLVERMCLPCASR